MKLREDESNCSKKLTINNLREINVYTDGSCHTQLLIGAWAAILFIDGQRIELSGIENNTTHNAMELMAVIKVIEYLSEHYPSHLVINIITDSQYVAGLFAREAKLSTAGYITKKGNEVRNADLVKRLYDLNSKYKLNFTKVKAHQKSGEKENINAEVDVLVRGIMRMEVDRRSK